MQMFVQKILFVSNMFISDIDGILIYFNTLFSLFILTGPWYVITTTHFFNHTNCLLNKGTVIVPFVTELCGTYFMDIPESNWNSVYVLSIFLFISFVLLQLLHKYEKYRLNKKIGLLLHFLILPIQCGILYLALSVVTKPDHVDEKKILAVIISGIVLSFLRVFKLVYFFFHGESSSNNLSDSNSPENKSLIPPQPQQSFKPGRR
jgi:hypothetical protein